MGKGDSKYPADHVSLWRLPVDCRLPPSTWGRAAAMTMDVMTNATKLLRFVKRLCRCRAGSLVCTRRSRCAASGVPSATITWLAPFLRKTMVGYRPGQSRGNQSRQKHRHPLRTGAGYCHGQTPRCRGDANQADALRLAARAGFVGPSHRFFDAVGGHIQLASFKATLNAPPIHLYKHADTFVQGKLPVPAHRPSHRGRRSTPFGPLACPNHACAPRLS